jgi:SSS family solute:Na+ symporter
MTFGWPALHNHYASIPAAPHFLHLMFVTVWACVGFALLINRFIFGRRAEFEAAKITRVLKEALGG